MPADLKPREAQRAKRGLTRTQRRVLNVLDANGGAVTYQAGSNSVRLMGLPGRQKLSGPMTTVTALYLDGLLRLGDGGEIALTDRGRAALATNRHPQRKVFTGAVAEGAAGILAAAGASAQAAHDAIAEIRGPDPWLPLEIPAALRERLARVRVELQDLSRQLVAQSRRAQGDGKTRKEAA